MTKEKCMRCNGNYEETNASWSNLKYMLLCPLCCFLALKERGDFDRKIGRYY